MRWLVLLLPITASAGPYIEVGLGVPLNPDYGYIPDQYGIFSAGYRHHVDAILSVDIGFDHRSLTGSDHCNNGECDGTNAIEAKVRLEW